MIVDVHVPLGTDYTFDEEFRREDLLAKIAEYAVDVQIVQPGTCHDLASVQAQHDAIAALCSAHPGRFLGMANPSPHLPRAAYHAEVRRCVRDLGFVALKLHPLGHGVRPGSRDGREAFVAAAENGVPLMVHTGNGYPFAAPLEVLPLAREFPDLTVIMAHMGNITYAVEAARVLEECPNTFGDTSWSPGYMLERWTRQYGARLMLGTDHAENTGTELAKIRTTRLTPAEQDDILGGTAARLFGLHGRV